LVLYQITNKSQEKNLATEVTPMYRDFAALNRGESSFEFLGLIPHSFGLAQDWQVRDMVLSWWNVTGFCFLDADWRRLTLFVFCLAGVLGESLV
jgi:hypothetical protein